MAKNALDKIRIIGLRKHYDLFVQEVQKQEVLQLIPFEGNSTAEKSVASVPESEIARMHSAIEFLANYTSNQPLVEKLLTGGKIVMKVTDFFKKAEPGVVKTDQIVSKALELKENNIREANQLSKLKDIQLFCEELKDWSTVLSVSYDTEFTQTFIGELDSKVAKETLDDLCREFHQLDVSQIKTQGTHWLVRVTAPRDIASQVQKQLDVQSFQSLDFSLVQNYYGMTAADVIKQLSREQSRLESALEDIAKKSTELARSLKDLKVVAEQKKWQLAQWQIQDQMFLSEQTFAFDGWIDARDFPAFYKWIKNAFLGDIYCERIAVAEDEEIPVKMSNRLGIRSFEPIIEMYGLPKRNDLDPTLVMAPFFFVFFGLCLSDVGYGGILFLVASWFLLFGKFSKVVKDSIGLLWLCGLAAMAGGVILGGYVGLTPEQLPWLQNPATGTFYGQLLNANENPMQFLILAFCLGVVHVLLGLLIDAYNKIQSGQILDAICGPLSWLYFLVTLGMYALADTFGLDKTMMGYLAISGAALILVTQGRSQKNWLLKPVFGLLGLYNITAYVSDILSYSRIMALGLATGVVAFAMNFTAEILAGLMPHPILGIIVAIVIIIFGHVLNFSLSLLGALIHTSRLQFIEFFGKFYDGGAQRFQPFKRSFDYVHLED